MIVRKLVILLLVLSAAGVTPAQDKPRKAAPAKAAPKAAEKPAKPTPKKPDGFAIVNARAYTISGPVLDRATIFVRDGKIVAVGTSVELPEGCATFDAKGRSVLPGFVAPRMLGIGVGRVTGKIADSLDPFARSLELALSAGVTSGFTSSGSTSAVIKLTYGTLDGMLVAEPAAETLNYAGADGNGRAQVVAAFERAKQYLIDLPAYEKKRAAGDKSAKPPSSRGIESYLRLLQGETPARFTGVGGPDRVRACLALVERFKFRATLEDATGAWIVAPDVARAGVRVIAVPRLLRPRDERVSGPSGVPWDAVARLHRGGVRFGLMPPGGRFMPAGGISLGGIAGHDLLTIQFEGAAAVRAGLRPADALRALTLDAAEILGVDDRVGSIEPGKDADLILMSGDPLDYRSWVLRAWVNGRLAFEKSRARIVADIPVR